jgi:hypothetical protein
MKTQIKNMIRFFAVLTAMITAIGVGSYGMFYALIYGWLYVLMFIISAAGLAFGLYTLKIVSEKLK